MDEVVLKLKLDDHIESQRNNENHRSTRKEKQYKNKFFSLHGDITDLSNLNRLLEEFFHITFYIYKVKTFKGNSWM